MTERYTFLQTLALI